MVPLRSMVSGLMLSGALASYSAISARICSFLFVTASMAFSMGDSVTLELCVTSNQRRMPGSLFDSFSVVRSIHSVCRTHTQACA